MSFESYALLTDATQPRVELGKRKLDIRRSSNATCDTLAGDVSEAFEGVCSGSASVILEALRFAISSSSRVVEKNQGHSSPRSCLS